MEDVMANPLVLRLSDEQRQELERLRDYAAKPHLREKAAALLKIADGQSGLQVGLHGLLRRRDADTIYRWVKRYQAEGLAGLTIRQGRGRKAAFFPYLPDSDSGPDGAAARGQA
jgi:hypothetical protein